MYATPRLTRRLTIALAMLMALAGAAIAQVPTSAPKLPVKAYQMIIDGTATLVGKWECGGEVGIEAMRAPSAEPLPAVSQGIQLISVTASVPDIECGNSIMNKHFRKALKMESFPEIRYQAQKYTLVENGSAVQTSGQLTIAGVTKNVDFGAKMIPLPGGGTRVLGNVKINMNDYGVKPPSLFWGIVRVAKVVTVRFDTIVRLPDTQALFMATRKTSTQ